METARELLKERKMLWKDEQSNREWIDVMEEYAEQYAASKDAEIERLKAELQKLRVDVEREIVEKGTVQYKFDVCDYSLQEMTSERDKLVEALREVQSHDGMDDEPKKIATEALKPYSK